MTRNKLFSGVLLIAGTSIGAGMLALPVKTAAAGFIPFFVFFLIAWGFMLASGLLLLEANLALGAQVSMAVLCRRVLGSWAKWITILTFLFLFYCLMTAYLSGSALLMGGALEYYFSWSLPKVTLLAVIALFFGSVVYFGARVVDLFNRVLMIGLVVSYGLLMIQGVGYVKIEHLGHQNWSVAAFALPVMIIMFGFQNLVPSLINYLGKEPKLLFRVIFFGTILTFIVCLLWVWMILGAVPTEFLLSFGNAGLATQPLQEVVGNNLVSLFANLFSFFAIVTSLLGVALSLMDFIGDGLHLKKGCNRLILLCGMVLVPPFFLCLYGHQVFMRALDLAGGFATVILFGFLPVLMVWKLRYTEGNHQHAILKGGKFVLVLLLCVGLGIFTVELLQELRC